MALRQESQKTGFVLERVATRQAGSVQCKERRMESYSRFFAACGESCWNAAV